MMMMLRMEVGHWVSMLLVSILAERGCPLTRLRLSAGKSCEGEEGERISEGGSAETPLAGGRFCASAWGYRRQHSHGRVLTDSRAW